MSYTTRQKLIVSAVIEKSNRPLTPLEICEAAKAEIPSLGMATVYRALKQFVEEGTVRVVEVPGAPPHYEHVSRHHHHFFLCKQCRHLFALAGCARGVNAMAPAGFQVESHEIILYGNCPDCLPA
jgi:Fur family ferric uptake transcriptional regulator